MNYYNEHDPKAAAWLRALIEAGEIPAGVVDERSIVEIKATELSEYAQCHFFAGIGGWSLALKLAGWPATRQVWTGSCPCQPYSTGGAQKGNDDPRNLWPAFFRLIQQRHPDQVFGEQVENAIGHEWLDGIQADLEGEGYAVGHCVLGAHSVGAPHIRQRLYWMADATESRLAGTRQGPASASEWSNSDSQREILLGKSANGSRLGNADDARSQGRGEHRDSANQLSAWASSVAIACTDGKTRRIESGSFPLAHGIPGRVGLLRGYGNAIVPQVASEFIGAWLDTSNAPGERPLADSDARRSQ
jgi:DNA (cytosine-5)-methyltransferase 1